jgi:integrase
MMSWKLIGLLYPNLSTKERTTEMPRLTDADLRYAKIGELTDGDGLTFLVRASRRSAKPRRSWVLRIMIHGKARKLGLGSYPLVGLAEARRRAQDARRALTEGKDPSVTAKRQASLLEAARAMTLAEAIGAYLAKAAPTFKSAKSDEIRTRALHVHFAPLHTRDVTAIVAADVAGVLRPLAAETAKKAHNAIRAVFDYAAAKLEPHGVILANPADVRRLRALGWSPRSAKASAPHPALDWRQAPEFMAELARQDSIEARCLAFAILTVARAGAARQAKWRDIDLERRIWSVPIADLKDSEHRTAPFIVPLSPAAIELLETLPRQGAFLFPNTMERPINDQAIIHLLRRMHRRGAWLDPATGKPATAHGFRATFRTWAKAKRLDREIAELVLGHAFYGAVESVYARDDAAVLALRRDMLELWARHCAGESAAVIAFPGTRA